MKGADSLINLVIDENESDVRLDVFLAREAGFVSREEAKKAIKEGWVFVNEHVAKPSYVVRSGDVITGKIPARITPAKVLKPEPIPLEVLYEDNSIVVINKPAGLVVHPGAGNYTGTLVHALLFHCRNLAPQGAPLRPGIVHRLDKGTSGVLVVAKTATAYKSLVMQFKEGSVQKKYYALVYGNVKDDVGMLETGIQRHPKDRKKMAVTLEGGRKAITRWKVKSRFDQFCLLEVSIKTGRTHQIRAHFSYLGHPVVGDSTYGGHRRINTIRNTEIRSTISGLKRHLLHAYFLSFNHPETGERVSYTLPLPEEFKTILGLLTKRH